MTGHTPPHDWTLWQASTADIDHIRTIEEQCFVETERWSRGQYRSALDNGGTLLIGGPSTRHAPSICETEGQGFLLFHHLVDDAELLKIAVSPKARHQGLGHALLEACCTVLRHDKLTRLLLELRADNGPALGFYRSFGFQQIADRPHYYRDGSHALVLAYDLTG